MNKCKNCHFFIKNKGCGAYYPPAKVGGEYESDCEFFETNRKYKARMAKILKAREYVSMII